MIDLTRSGQRLAGWLDEALPTLTAVNSVDMHIDQACGRSLSPQEQIEGSVGLFAWVLSNLASRLAGKIVMLMIPLQSSQSLERTPPAWASLPAQLSRTPPSIYAMAVTALLQPDTALRYIAPMEVPGLTGESLAAYYQCWRHPEDPQQEGWARDLRVLSTRFLRP
jgi:hypothetical protein